MVMDVDILIKENENLILEKDELQKKLNEANEIIEGIKKGNIDALLIGGNENEKVFVSETADQTYRKFIENMSEGVVTIHTDGIILYSNTSFAKLVDAPLEKLIGTNLLKFIPIENIENFEQFFINKPQNNSKMDLSILDHAGQKAHFIVSLNIFHLNDFAVLNLVWTDVTYQKNTEEKLEAVNENLKGAIEELKSSENRVEILNSKLEENIKILKESNIELGTFAHIASHDLQEPLRKIITYSGILRSDYYNIIDQKGQTYINKMQSSSSRMRDLINDILQYSELSHNDILFELTDLQSIIKEIISDFEIVIKETNAEIIIENELPVIEANAIQMRQLLQNIISNSLKFIKPGVLPQIRITSEIVKANDIAGTDVGVLNEKVLVIKISDNGIGFNQDYASKIFTIFQRLNNNSLYKGTGIGLAICKKIIETHHGIITAESKMKEGAIFTIAIPVFHVKTKPLMQLA
jgi:two-component system CheB/CheR fusion protein